MSKSFKFRDMKSKSEKTKNQETEFKIPPGTNARTYSHRKFSGEQNNGKSLTIQGEAYTIQQLMERAVAQGQLLGEVREQDYLDVTEIDEVNQFYSRNIDLTDLENLRIETQNMADKIKHLQDKKYFAQQELHAQVSQEKAAQKAENSTGSEKSNDKPEKADNS